MERPFDSARNVLVSSICLPPPPSSPPTSNVLSFSTQATVNQLPCNKVMMIPTPSIWRPLAYCFASLLFSSALLCFAASFSLLPLILQIISKRLNFNYVTALPHAVTCSRRSEALKRQRIAENCCDQFQFTTALEDVALASGWQPNQSVNGITKWLT